MKFIFTLLLGIVSFVMSKTHAILLAGSNEYSNFRHQADICQAYQQLHKAGIPDERIYVWMYDDIANNEQNPHPGTIRNYFGGPDVYAGVPKDFTGDDVTPENFMKFLRGENMKGIGSGKTLTSTKDDKVFIFYSDHGGPDIICFPGFVEMGAKDLSDTLKFMQTKNMYKEMVFYLEACESGSMFDKWLSADQKIYAVTASTPSVSSWACDYDSDYQAYLNDCWSRNFLNDSRTSMAAGTFNKRTYKQQAEWVGKQTTESPQCIYGDKTNIPKEVLSQFQGEGVDGKFRMPAGRPGRERIQAHDVDLVTLQKRLAKAKNSDAQESIQEEIDQLVAHRTHIDERWNSFASKLNLDLTTKQSNDQCIRDSIVDNELYMAAIKAVKAHCGSFDNYSSKYYSYVHKAIEQGLFVEQVEEVAASICN